MWLLRWVSHASDVYVYGSVILIERERESFTMACFPMQKILGPKRKRKKKKGIFRRVIS